MRKDFDSPIIMVKEGESTPCGLYIPYGVVTNSNNTQIYDFLSETIRINLKIVYKFVCSVTNEGYVCLVHKDEPSIGGMNDLRHSINSIIDRINIFEDDTNIHISNFSDLLNKSINEKNVGESMYILYEFLPDKLKKELKIHIKQ